MRLSIVGEVGDLRLARRVLDDGLALGEHRGGEQVLGGADARELEHDARAATARLARASMKPCTTSISTPIASRPRKCMSSWRLPMLSPPGIATRASPQRASSGPSTLIDARMRRDQLVGRLRRGAGPTASICSSVGAGPLDVRADRAQHVDHHVEVGDGVDVAQRGDARARAAPRPSA